MPHCWRIGKENGFPSGVPLQAANRAPGAWVREAGQSAGTNGGLCGGPSQVVGGINRLLAGINAGKVERGPGSPRRPLRRGSGAGLARVQEGRPRDGLGQGGQISEHDLHDVADGIGGIFGPPVTFEPAVDEELKEIESQCPNQQDSSESIGGCVSLFSFFRTMKAPRSHGARDGLGQGGQKLP